MKRWPTKPLEEIAELYGGSTPSRDSPAFWDGDIPWVTPTDLPMPDEGISVISKSKDRITQAGLDNSSATVVPKGTVLFSSRATIGKVAVAGMPLTTNQGFANFVPHSGVTSRFLAYALWFHREDIARLSGSTTFKEVSRGTLRKYHLPVPPLAEQERMVKLLDEADELRKLRAQADRRTGALIPALFHEMFGDSDSRNWKEHSFGEPVIMEIVDGDRGNNYPNKADFREEGYCLFLNTSNVRKGAFEFSKCDFITREKDDELRKGKLSRGDVILTTRGTLGNSAHYSCGIKHENVRINSGMVILRANSTLLLPEYLLVILNSDGFANQVSAMTSGSAQPQLPINRLSKIKFILPPLALQKEFAARVSELRAMQAEQATSRRRLENLFQSMLHRAFKGEL